MKSDMIFQKRGRDRLSVVAQVLDVALDGIPKTQIMQRARLSVPQLYEYLSFLLTRKLIMETETNGKTVYQTTAKGMRFLQAYREAKSLLITEGDEEAIRRPSIVVAIPAFNEEKTIAKVILQALKYADRVIVCDDGSRDMTAEIAERLGAEVIRHEKNMGYGASLQSLFRRTKDLNADVMVTLDADGQHDPNEIPTLIKPILKDDVDVVIGSRFLLTEKTRYVPFYRRLGMKAISKLIKISTNKGISDAQSGFRAYNRKSLDELAPFDERGMGASVEILMRGFKSGLKMVEVPTECRYVR